MIHTHAAAAVITPNNPLAPVVTDTVNPAGYYLFDTYPDVANHPAAADINALPGYASLTEEAPLFGPESLSPDLTVDEITYKGDGVTFANAGPATGGVPGTGTPVEFATFALGSGTPTAFTVGVLSDYPDVTYYQLNLYSGNPNTTTTTPTLLSPAPTPLASVIIDPDQTVNPGDNEFYYADITGAADGDYLVVNGYTPDGGHGGQVTLGGVTFDAIPEPSTYALMFAGLGMLLVIARFRRSNG